MENIVSQDLMLVESKTMRDQYSDKVEVLDKVKALTLLPDDMHVTTEMAANYYEVGVEAIRSLIKDRKHELEEDGLCVLKGEKVKSFKNLTQLKIKSKHLTIIPKRAILRIGMLLRDSEVAKAVRTQLLNMVNNSITNNNSIDKMQALENQVLYLSQKMSMMDQACENLALTVVTQVEKSMSTFTEGICNRLLPIEQQNQQLLSQNKETFVNVKDSQHNINKIDSKIDIMQDTFIFKPYTNSSYKFSDLVIKLGFSHNLNNIVQHFVHFYKILQNWLNVEFPKVTNTKQYILSVYGIDICEKLITGIMQGRIVKSKQGNWIDLNGYAKNDVEFDRTVLEFEHRCAYCGIKGDSLVPEHIISQSKENSTDIIYNIVPACKKCNQDKFDAEHKEWYRKQPFWNEYRENKINEHWHKYFINIDNNK